FRHRPKASTTSAMCLVSRASPLQTACATVREIEAFEVGNQVLTSSTMSRMPRLLASGDEVPHILTRKSRLQPGEFLINSAKRHLQQYRYERDVPTRSDSLRPHSYRNLGGLVSDRRRRC